MEQFYTEAQRTLQNEFSTRDLAERIKEAVVTEALSDQQAAFIHSRNMFYLSTVDELGYPSCSYKGGDIGFVRVIDPKTIVFPNYDGNGMFMSTGNIQAKSKIGLLFIDFQTPQRIRVRGKAKCIKEGPILKSYPGANLVVELTVSNAWINCPRYIHRMDLSDQSPYIPAKDGTIPLALWKRVDLVQDVITDKDRAEAESLGIITIDEYEANVANGKLL
ncbi:pyridoxamine 5'-phosphate oxidase family protein [Gammaproteobacteria bacterium]|nr:pyridoxamine 5'-phosphate oxidase family protein [Gammaproteobacteria bacterium]|tara:strand:- start:675 stop:1331 length:657 start_codon:yes stop_codon:yes gene_type:complete